MSPEEILLLNLKLMFVDELHLCSDWLVLSLWKETHSLTQSHRKPQLQPSSDDTALSLRWTWVKEKTVHFIFSPPDWLLVWGPRCWPGEGVVKYECVLSSIPDFQFPLDRLFVGITACQWDQNLPTVRIHRLNNCLPCKNHSTLPLI